MKPYLRDYIKIYENHVDDKLCNRIVNELDSSNWEKHTSYDSLNKKYVLVNKDKEFDTTKLHTKSSEKLSELIGRGFYKYINEFNFPFFGRIDQYTFQRYNRYTKDTSMYLHVDHIHSIFDGERKGIPILTGLVALNNDYEGGQFIMWENTELKLKQGSMIVFPSNFMYPHRVNTITSGARHSCVSWAF